MLPVSELEVRTRSGSSFRVDACGDAGAPLVLLLHGFPQTRYAWRSQLPSLAAAGLRAIAPDQRGYSPGARPREVEAYAQSKLCEDVLELADALGAAHFHLVGHDWGGQLAWRVGASHPERVRSLAVLSRPHPAAFAESLRRDRGQTTRSKHHVGFLDPAMTDRLLEEDARRLRRMLSRQGVRDADVDAYLSVLSERDALDAALNWYRAARIEDAGGMAAAGVPKIQVPTLYVWGCEDATVGRAAAERTEIFVAAEYRFVEVPGAGHFLTDQVPDRIDRELLDWLRPRMEERE